MKGKLLEVKEYIYGTLNGKTTYKYSKKGKVIEEKNVTYWYKVNPETVEEYIVIKKFDESDKLVEDRVISPDGNSGKTIISYNEIGNIIEKIDYNNYEEPVSKTEYIYSK